MADTDPDVEPLTVNTVEGSGANVGAAIVGAFGTLTLNANGTYTYVVNNALAAVQGLSNLETLTEQFDYTVTDGTATSNTATLTVTIFGTDDPAVITNLTPSAEGGDAVVDEDDLLATRGLGESAGSDPTKDSLTVTGTFNISAPDGLDDLTIGGNAVITNGVFAGRRRLRRRWATRCL